jgi:hypothetical protein
MESNVAMLEKDKKTRWLVSITSLFFVVLQSACTAVMAISGIRVVIGLSALAAASGLGRPAGGFHQDAIRIPMMVIAVLGSVINLYVIWRIRSLRSRPAAQWRMTAPSNRQIRSEQFQIALAIFTLLLVVAEWITHHIVHNA